MNTGIIVLMEREVVILLLNSIIYDFYDYVIIFNLVEWVVAAVMKFINRDNNEISGMRCESMQIR